MEKMLEQMRIKRERKNPFENEQVAIEWITNVENEKSTARDKEIYPRLQKWINKQPKGLVVEIGSGQGICSHNLGDFDGIYVGVEPSIILTARAKELNDKENCDFIVGDAYHLPIESEKAEASFSVMVWFHLNNLNEAASEMARILKVGGKFLIITASPEATEHWESKYYDAIKEGKKTTGKVKAPISPVSKSIYYKHTLKEILYALKNNGLSVEKKEYFGLVKNKNILFSIEGKKNNEI